MTMGQAHDKMTRTTSPVQDQPMAHHTRSRHDSITIEELSDGDFGYDADIEILRPDESEEPDSDTGEPKSSIIERQHDYDIWQSRLAEKMTALDCNSDTNGSQGPEDRPPSRKRRSRDHADAIWVDSSVPNSSAGLEVIEIMEDSDPGHHAKRPRRKARRTKTSERIIHTLPTIGIGARDVHGNMSGPTASSQSSMNTPSPVQTAAEDAMEVD